MSVENTLSRFRLISGMDADELLSWSELVTEAREYLDSLVIKEKVSLVDEKRLDNAAAVYAYYRYLSYTSERETSFSAGDLKVSFNNDKIKAAKEMWETELNGIKDIVDNNESLFLFKRVKY